MTEVKAGQIWLDLDPRVEAYYGRKRYVEVNHIEGDRAVCASFAKSDSGWVPTTTRQTKIAVSRLLSKAFCLVVDHD